MAKHILIEKTAGELAGTAYEELRSLGFKSKHKNARAYARANIEMYVPAAVRILTAMLDRNDISAHMKTEIYDALLERANDPNLAVLDSLEPAPKPAKTILHI